MFTISGLHQLFEVRVENREFPDVTWELWQFGFFHPESRLRVIAICVDRRCVLFCNVISYHVIGSLHIIGDRILYFGYMFSRGLITGRRNCSLSFLVSCVFSVNFILRRCFFCVRFDLRPIVPLRNLLCPLKALGKSPDIPPSMLLRARIARRLRVALQIPHVLIINLWTPVHIFTVPF